MLRIFSLLLFMLAFLDSIKAPSPGHRGPIKLRLLPEVIEDPRTSMPKTHYVLSVTSRNTVKVLLDTTFNHLFVPLKQDLSCSSGLHNEPGFDTTNSKKLDKEETTINYRSSSIRGDWYQDIIFMDQNWKIGLTMDFLLADSSSVDFSAEPWDGVFGLGPKPRDANETGHVHSRYPYLLSYLLEQHWIYFPQFSIQKRDLTSEQISVLDISLGGFDVLYDMQKFEPQDYSLGESWWVPLSLVSLGDESIGCDDRETCQAVINTGNSDILGPRDQVERIYRAMGFEPYLDGSTYAYCDSLKEPVLSFTFEGVKRDLKKEWFVKQVPDDRNNMCYITIYPNNDDNNNTWNLGTDFLRVYSVAVDAGRNTISMSKIIN